MSISKASPENGSSELTVQAPEPISEQIEASDGQPATQAKISTVDPSTRQTPGPDTPTSRPTTGEQKEAEHTLIEAFPSIEAKVVRAVLVASGGNLEQAFYALLGMSDPDFTPPAPQHIPQTTAERRQMQQDETYARQLAQHYQSSRSGRGTNDPPLPARPRSDRDRLYGGGGEERERNFFDDDLPEIKEGVKKTFLETQTMFTNWMTKLSKKLDGDDDDPYNGPPALNRPDGSQYGRRPEQNSQGRSRKSGDTDAFDADPQVLGDDFHHLELRDDYSAEGHNPPLPGRPAANPDLFKPTPPTPPQSGPVDEVDAAERKNQSTNAPMSGSKSAKWQPLTSLEPRTDPEENDPFSVGDEGDELADDKTKDVREADSARLKKAASLSQGQDHGQGEGEGGSGADKPVAKQLIEHEKGSVDTKDKTAEELLTGTAAGTAGGTTAGTDKKDNAVEVDHVDKS